MTREEIKTKLETILQGTDGFGENLKLLDAYLKSGEEIDPKLKHYLERRSYEKAYQFIHGAE